MNDVTRKEFAELQDQVQDISDCLLTVQAMTISNNVLVDDLNTSLATVLKVLQSGLHLPRKH